MTSSPTKAATGYRLIARILQCTQEIQEGHPELLRKHKTVMRKLLSLANGLARMTFKDWVDYQQRIQPSVSDAAITIRSVLMIQNILRDLNEAPPEFVEPITARLQLILTTLNAIGRTLWKGWKDYDARF